ncbi:gamma-glutamylcyclotransferase [Nostoc sp. UCD121]|uniref:gamma-glutamylcyclotransferase n=1 Tax=unclassified Nostoc TaxID=2593658 RepID=UPI00162A21F7|nr:MULTISPECIES: gamma-glutamylcyclotransferase [unclassified Nostoc]MBC1223523.1 gamma-glutamylcyclotransferase [Nostoc sp. UCD120]MBC1277053.1 gamma-glutamylcyclotransferase [Nostoc sp. UCD121]MBC1294986.1 gamma-glutamylcyclotransferase [Nostoc sp. UCD122]
MSLSRSDLEAGNAQTRLFEASHSGIKLTTLSKDELQRSLHEILQHQLPNSDIWIFAYGSLIWNPLITYVERRAGIIYGWHRRFCTWMILGRGTPENPGLLLGLDRGGSCRGIVYRIAAADVASELLLVWRREMLAGVYVARWVRVFDGTQEFKAIAFVANRQHPRYAHQVPLTTTVNSIATASGKLGSCADYLLKTVDGLIAEGIKDRKLLLLRKQVLAKQQALLVNGGSTPTTNYE